MDGLDNPSWGGPPPPYWQTLVLLLASDKWKLEHIDFNLFHAKPWHTTSLIFTHLAVHSSCIVRFIFLLDQFQTSDMDNTCPDLVKIDETSDYYGSVASSRTGSTTDEPISGFCAIPGIGESWYATILYFEHNDLVVGDELKYLMHAGRYIYLKKADSLGTKSLLWISSFNLELQSWWMRCKARCSALLLHWNTNRFLFVSFHI